jgi:glyoxylase-like metal-dependent hydrolase (beta-lactamase superfamily II)
MKVILLNNGNTVYTSNAYLALGSWNRLDDVNTLVDVGADESIMDEIEKAHTGVGKRKVDQVILTHNHFDHNGILRIIKERYNPKVYAFSEGENVDALLGNGQSIQIGDQRFEVLHAPYHSSDSICLYCEDEGALFSGDTPLNIVSTGGSYTKDFAGIIERLIKLNIQTIYPGHDIPSKKGVKKILEMTLKNVKTAGLHMF